MKNKTLKTLLVLSAILVGTGVSRASVVIDNIAYILNETKQVAAVTTGGTYTGAVVIPSTITYDAVTYSVVSIGKDAFKSCTGLTAVTIPNSVTSIGNYAFYGCSKLASVTIPNSVTSIGEYAFYKCSSLTSVTIPNSVTGIGSSAFSGCSGLTSVTIPNSVTSIGDYAFADCSSLTEITIPNSVTSIGEYAFSGCSSLTSVTIPNSVTSIRKYAFSGCSSLTSVTIPNSVTSIGVCAFNGCRGLTSVTIGNGVKYIESSAFQECSRLIRVNISDLTAWCKINFTYNGSTAITSANPLYYAHHLYLNGTEITNLVIPGDVQSISACVFHYCSSLTSVTIPSTVTDIESGAFKNCNSLVEIYDYRETPQLIGASVFNGVEKSICTLYVPYNAVTAYQNAGVWKEFRDIVPFGFNTFTVSTSATNGTVTGGGLYAEGSTATLIATPATGYRFTQWSDGNTDNPRTVTVSGDQQYTAMFVKVAYTVTVNQNCSITVK